jgi:hypothetical protein
MLPSELRDEVPKCVRVTPQSVYSCKLPIAQWCDGTQHSEYLISRVAAHYGPGSLPLVPLYATADPFPAIKQAGEHISWFISAIEAMLSLLNSGFLIPKAAMQDTQAVSVPYTLTDRHGFAENFEFPQFRFLVPGLVSRAPSFEGSAGQYLYDPDLYLSTLNIPNMHIEVQAALREAVRCFRYDLFTAAVAMLGKASESAWTELGISLLAAVPDTEQSSVKKQRDVLQDPMLGTMKKIDAVNQLYGRQDLFLAIATSTGVKPAELQRLAIWSDLVRDSRNTIHFGVEAATPNTRDKVAELLLAAPQRLRILYSLKASADAPSVQGSGI